MRSYWIVDKLAAAALLQLVLATMHMVPQLRVNQKQEQKNDDEEEEQDDDDSDESTRSKIAARVSDVLREVINVFARFKVLMHEEE